MSDDHSFDQLILLSRELEDAVEGAEIQPVLASLWASFVSVADSVVSERRTYTQFLEYEGPDAQSIINSIHWVLEHRSLALDPYQKARLCEASLSLCISSRLLPTSLRLQKVSIETRPTSGTPDIDIYRGSCQDRPVFVKLHRGYHLQPQEVHKRVVNAAIIWSTTIHPRIVPFLGITHHSEAPPTTAPCLVFPIFANGTVGSYLLAFPNCNRGLLLRDVIHGMSYIHSNHIVHGDIKGANVLITSSGRASIADLELSCARVSRGGSISVGSRSNVSLATVPWRAPELLRSLWTDEATAPAPTPSTDVYAFACLAYEVFTKEAPFWHFEARASSPFVRLQMIIEAVVVQEERPEKPLANSDSQRLFGLTPEMWQMMEDCWNKDPFLRPSAADLSGLAVFAAIIDERPID